MKTLATKTVTVDGTNTKLTIITRRSTGPVKCTGEAHENAHIDNCMLCLGSKHGYGTVEGFADCTVEDVLTSGCAVPCSWTNEDASAFLDAEKAGLIKFVNVNQNHGRGSRSNFNVWVKA